MPAPGAQPFSVKRAQVEFHKFASLGEPERAIAVYREENIRRGAILKKHQQFIGEMSPFLEIGANAGHTSYLLANEFGASGFALDISADALRHGIALMDSWRLARAPIRLAGDAAALPFRDGSLRLVLAFQLLSQFMDIESLIVEVKRVLAPGGIFVFGEEPVLRLLSLRLYRCPYYDRMKPWERKLYDWGLLGYLVRDVIGAGQEESFGIRQNHSLYLNDWYRLIRKHFVEQRYELFVPERGWGERVVKRLAVRLDPGRTVWRAGRLLGGTFWAICRKEGEPVLPPAHLEHFETLLRCPDCGGPLERDAEDMLACRCSFRAANEGGVFTLLRSAERAELYPGDRPDTLDFSLPGHTPRLLEGWHDLEGIFGNKFRWMGASAAARLVPVRPGAHKLRVRGYADPHQFTAGQPVTVELRANGRRVSREVLHREGLFVIEAPLTPAQEYHIAISCSPCWQAPGEDRVFTVNISMIRLVPLD